MPRLFLAMEIPNSVREHVAAVQAQVKKQMKRSDIRWVLPKQFHITLHFIGEVSTEVMTALQESLSQMAYPAPFELALKEISAFPHKKNPKVLFVETTLHPSLIGLRKRMADTLMNRGIPIDIRKWTPHITIGRVERRSEVFVPEKILLEPLHFTVDQFVLMESSLTSEAPYKKIAHFALGAPKE